MPPMLGRFRTPRSCSPRFAVASSMPRELFDAHAKEFASRGEGTGVNVTHWAAAVLYNGLARYHDAYSAAEAVLEDPDDLSFGPFATVELVEAASRTGRGDAAVPALERLEAATTASGAPWGVATAARSRRAAERRRRGRRPVPRRYRSADSDGAACRPRPIPPGLRRVAAA